MCSVRSVLTFCVISYHGSRSLPIEEESGGSGCECNRGREGEADEEQESSVPGTKEKGTDQLHGSSALLASVSVCACVHLLIFLRSPDQLNSCIPSPYVHTLAQVWRNTVKLFDLV